MGYIWSILKARSPKVAKDSGVQVEDLEVDDGKHGTRKYRLY